MTNDFRREIENSLAYLNSPAALASVAIDPYWPKWDTPWWHVLALHEMGESRRLPGAIVEALIRALNAYPVKNFPFREEDLPPGVNPYCQIACHCQIGNIYQALSAAGADLDKEAPWLRRRLLSYQMADGGLTCDNEAYLVEGETPSSMVGTIAVFEAVLHCTPRAFTEEEDAFLQKGAGFLIGRRLIEGSPTKYNAEEREQAKEWVHPFFPRFYFYDVLRGLHALLTYAEKTGRPVPREAIAPAFEILAQEFSAGEVRNAGRAYGETSTIRPAHGDRPQTREPASLFPLLNAVNVAGASSPFLTRQWREVRAMAERYGLKA